MKPQIDSCCGAYCAEFCDFCNIQFIRRYLPNVKIGRNIGGSVYLKDANDKLFGYIDFNVNVLCVYSDYEHKEALKEKMDAIEIVEVTPEELIYGTK